jgi:hypothetical protein
MSSALQHFRATMEKLKQRQKELAEETNKKIEEDKKEMKLLLDEMKEKEKARGAKVEKPFIRREWINDFQVGEEITVKDYHSGFLPAKVLKINKNTITIEIRRNPNCEFSKLRKEVRYERESLKKIGEQ